MLLSIITKEIEQALYIVKTNKYHELPPYNRFVIYNSYSSYNIFFRNLFCNYLSILTVKKVAPIWEKDLLRVGLLDGGLLTDNHLRARLKQLIKLYVAFDKQFLLLQILNQKPLDKEHLYQQILALDSQDIQTEDKRNLLYILNGDPELTKQITIDAIKNVEFDWHIPIEEISNVDLIKFLILISERSILGELGIEIVKSFSEKFYHWLGGSFLGFDQALFPPTAFYVGNAAGKLLSQIIRNEPFPLGIKIEKHTSDSSFKINEGDPTWSATRAFAFNFSGWKDEINPQKSLEFWEWWLTEAIPQAWQLALETYRS